MGQIQPYYEARGLGPVELAGRQVPPLVTQIADGENGGVMTNEFPPRYLEVMRECSGSPTPAVNVTEYLEALAGRGISREDLPPVQPLLQHRVWERFEPGEGPERLAAVIGQLNAEDDRFSMEGGSWTSDISWMRGYDNVLAPMERASSLFGKHLVAPGVPASDPATGARSSICWPVKPAATATGARASGRTTAPSSPAAPARPTLADVGSEADLDEQHHLWPFIQGWAAELGLTGSDAINQASRTASLRQQHDQERERTDPEAGQ